MRRSWLAQLAHPLLLSAALLAPSGALAEEPPPSIPTAQSAQRHSFALFRGEPEGLPGTFRAVGATLRVRGQGLNPALAQQARPNRHQPALWAIPGRRTICLYVTPGDRRPARLACAATTEVVASGLELHYSGARGGSSIFGLAPDGIGTVNVRGNSDALPVRENAFAGRGEGLVQPIHIPPKAVDYPPVICPRPLSMAAPAPYDIPYEPEAVCRAGAIRE